MKQDLHSAIEATLETQRARLPLSGDWRAAQPLHTFTPH